MLCLSSRKYSLASIEYALKNRNEGQRLALMYDVVCQCQTRLEKEFPILKDEDTKYAVPIFHSYAHDINCQMTYNPRYSDDGFFGLTDGESVERLWSFLNGFASMSRSMLKETRSLLLTDAVIYYSRGRNEEIPRIIKKKYDECNVFIQAFDTTKEKKKELKKIWQQKAKAFAIRTKSKLKNFNDDVLKRMGNNDIMIYYFGILSRYLSLSKCYSKTNSTKEDLLNQLNLIEKNHPELFSRRFVRPTSLNDPFLEASRHLVDDQAAEGLKEYFLELIRCCCMYEQKKEKCKGSAKATKLSVALESFRRSAAEVKTHLNNHLIERYGMYIKELIFFS